MSHKATVKLKINDRDALTQALDLMGLSYDIATTENGLKVKSRFNVTEDVDIQLKNDANGTKISDVGFKKNSDGSYEAGGDFWDLANAKTKDGDSINQASFKDALSKRYAYIKAINDLQTNGFGISQEVEDWTANEIKFSMTEIF